MLIKRNYKNGSGDEGQTQVHQSQIFGVIYASKSDIVCHLYHQIEEVQNAIDQVLIDHSNFLYSNILELVEFSLYTLGGNIYFKQVYIPSTMFPQSGRIGSDALDFIIKDLRSENKDSEFKRPRSKLGLKLDRIRLEVRTLERYIVEWLEDEPDSICEDFQYWITFINRLSALIFELQRRELNTEWNRNETNHNQ